MTPEELALIKAEIKAEVACQILGDVIRQSNNSTNSTINNTVKSDNDRSLGLSGSVLALSESVSSFPSLLNKSINRSIDSINTFTNQLKITKPVICFGLSLGMLAIIISPSLTEQARKAIGIRVTDGNGLIGDVSKNNKKQTEKQTNKSIDITANASSKAQRLDKLADRVLAYMKANNMVIRTGDRRFNIIYIRRMNDDGTPNQGRPNYFDDMGGLLEIPSATGQPRFVLTWKATTRPGDGYVANPMSNYWFNGVRLTAEAAPGQYVAWSRGLHRGRDALVQVRPIKIFRLDKNRRKIRVQVANVAINQHDYLRASVITDETENNYASAGCYVTGREEHKRLMQAVSVDRDYMNNLGYVFPTLVVDRLKVGF